MRTHVVFVVAAALVAMACGCTTAPQTPAARADLQDDANVSLNRFQRSDASLTTVLDRSPGYAVFPSVGKGAWIVGGAYGKGVLYAHGRKVGYADMTAASIGLQGGGEDFSELIVFQTQQALNSFMNSTGYGLSAEVSAVIVKPGAAAAAEFKNGVLVFTLTNGGLMGAIAVGGQQFRYSPISEVAPEDNAQPASGKEDGNGRSDMNGGSGSNLSGHTSVTGPDGGDSSTWSKTNVSGSSSVSTPNSNSRVNMDAPPATKPSLTGKGD